MAALLDHAQLPELHEHWDLRFSGIDHVPRAAPNDPQRFRYATRIGLGLSISGTGQTQRGRDLADGSQSSALRFAVGDFLSLICQGSGYWRHVPTSGGVRFLTSYTYMTLLTLPGLPSANRCRRPAATTL